jgi:hypothetical protein
VEVVEVEEVEDNDSDEIEEVIRSSDDESDGSGDEMDASEVPHFCSLLNWSLTVTCIIGRWP